MNLTHLFTREPLVNKLNEVYTDLSALVPKGELEELNLKGLVNSELETLIDSFSHMVDSYKKDAKIKILESTPYKELPSLTKKLEKFVRNNSGKIVKVAAVVGIGCLIYSAVGEQVQNMVDDSISGVSAQEENPQIVIDVKHDSKTDNLYIDLDSDSDGKADKALIIGNYYEQGGDLTQRCGGYNSSVVTNPSLTPDQLKQELVGSAFTGINFELESELLYIDHKGIPVYGTFIGERAMDFEKDGVKNEYELVRNSELGTGLWKNGETCYDKNKSEPINGVGKVKEVEILNGSYQSPASIDLASSGPILVFLRLVAKKLKSREKKEKPIKVNYLPK